MTEEEEEYTEWDSWMMVVDIIGTLLFAYLVVQIVFGFCV